MTEQTRSSRPGPGASRRCDTGTRAASRRTRARGVRWRKPKSSGCRQTLGCGRHGACVLLLPRSGGPQHLLDFSPSRRAAEGLSDRPAHGVSRPHTRRSARANLYVGHGGAAERSDDRGACGLLCCRAAGSRHARQLARGASRPQDIYRGHPRRERAGLHALPRRKRHGNSTIPRLAGQHRAYIERQLEAFASKARANEIMHENSKNLTAEQIRDIAAYVRSL